jgi:uncharacterized protein YabE (DUF348 family)
MKLARSLAFTAIFFLVACQPAAPSLITILDGNQTVTLQTSERVPSALLEQAGIAFSANDRVLVNGLPVEPNHPITNHPIINHSIINHSITLQVRRAVEITLVTPNGEQALQSSAFTVGEALQDTSIWLRAGDQVEPGPGTSLTDGMKITLKAPRELTVAVDGKALQIHSSAQTVGEALAEAGIPLLGLDYSLPAENDPLPSDGQVRVVRVRESIVLAQKPIPFENDFQASADVPLDQTQITQPGENGLTVQRIRIHYENGEEISRTTENETMVRPPQARILAYGTKVEVKTAVVDGVEIEYWRAVQMYATSYSPCRSGTEKCYPGTSSGKTVQRGVVGLRYSWYLNMQGQRLYIPGYGFASVEDVCGGCVGKPWIDLGFSDNDFEPWHNWVTVYFLTPVPANVIYVLE